MSESSAHRKACHPCHETGQPAPQRSLTARCDGVTLTGKKKTRFRGESGLHSFTLIRVITSSHVTVLQLHFSSVDNTILKPYSLAHHSMRAEKDPPPGKKAGLSDWDLNHSSRRID